MRVRAQVSYIGFEDGDKGLPEEEVENLDELINDPKALLVSGCVGYGWHAGA